MSEETKKMVSLAEALRPAMEQLAAKDAKVDNAAREALVATLPGPLKRALASNQDITVGRWKVGPFRDCHYQWLAELEHPLERVMTRELIANVTNKPSWVADDLTWERAKGEVNKGLNPDPKLVDWERFWTDVQERYVKLGGVRKQEAESDTYIPRGPSMWQLAYIATQPPRKVLELFVTDGVDGVRRESAYEFGMTTMGDLMELFRAVSEQMKVYWSTAISHEEMPIDKEGGGAPDAPANPFVT